MTTASAVQVRQPAHTRSIGRWRRYETQLDLMRQTLEEEGVPTDADYECGATATTISGEMERPDCVGAGERSVLQ